MEILRRSPSCGVIIIDNFYNNPMETRNYILHQEFGVRGNFPGQRTTSYATEQLKEIIQDYVTPFGGKITEFKIPNVEEKEEEKEKEKEEKEKEKEEKEKEKEEKEKEEIYNGSFQYTTSRDQSWVHIDGFNNWAGIVYMTPNAPLNSGTAFYKFVDGATCKMDATALNNQKETDRFSQDMTKWSLVDKVGNVFNRLVLFNANRYHMSLDYFGDNKENGRLFQVFFFSTER
jgi:hypothetical protein